MQDGKTESLIESLSSDLALNSTRAWKMFGVKQGTEGTLHSEARK